jgi:hypothetical protein
MTDKIKSVLWRYSGSNLESESAREEISKAIQTEIMGWIKHQHQELSSDLQTKSDKLAKYEAEDVGIYDKNQPFFVDQKANVVRVNEIK